MNTAKLKGKMREKEITQEEMAKKLGIALSTMNRKLQSSEDGDSFTVGEANRIFHILELSTDEAMAIFFADAVA